MTMDQSKDTDNFQWEDFIEPKTTPDESKILEFIVYKKIGSTKYVIKKFDNPKEQNLEILNVIKDILKSTSHLNADQLLEYCKSQRYFIKQYFKELKK